MATRKTMSQEEYKATTLSYKWMFVTMMTPDDTEKSFLGVSISRPSSAGGWCKPKPISIGEVKIANGETHFMLDCFIIGTKSKKPLFLDSKKWGGGTTGTCIQIKNSFTASKIQQGEESRELDRLINKYMRTPYMSDSVLVDGERYIQPELSNVLFCLMKDHENDNTELRDALIAECITSENLSMSPASGFSINAAEESDLQELLNDIGSPDDDSRSIGYSGSRGNAGDLARRALQAKANARKGQTAPPQMYTAESTNVIPLGIDPGNVRQNKRKRVLQLESIDSKAVPSAPKKKTKKSGDEATVLEHYENLATIETKSMVKIEIGKQKFDTIKIDVSLIQSPLREEATRELNEQWVTILVERFRRHTSYMVAPLACIVTGLESPGDFDYTKKELYQYRAIGGNHSRTTFQRLLDSHQDGVSADIVQNWKFRNCILFADNLTPNEAKFLGSQHNADTALTKTFSFMELLAMARGAYFKEDGITVKSCWLAGTADAGAVKLGEETTLLTKWKHSVLGQAAKPATKEELTKNSPMFSCARWSKELYDLVLALDKKWCNKELKGQGKAKKKGTYIGEVESIGQTYITALCGLEDEQIKTLLTQVLTGVIELKELKTKGLLAKKHMRFIQSCMTILNLDDAQQLEQRFGEQTMKSLFLQYASAFGKTPKNAPKNMIAHLTKINVEWLTRQKALQAARSAQEEKKDEDADPNVHMFTHSAVHLDSRSFRGSDAERSQYQKEFTDTNIYIHKADVLSVSDCFAGDYALVLIDPPYGKTNQLWDKAWTKDDFQKCVSNVMTSNKADAFTIISFCASEQISSFLEVLKAMIHTDDSPKTHTGSVYEAVWTKPDHYAQRINYSFLSFGSYIHLAYKGGNLSRDVEFIVVGNFSRRGSEFPIRSLFNFTVDESRSNVFSFKTCQKPIRCEVAGSANTTNVNSCQKPMRLIMRLIQHFSREGDTVLDLCAGTGTTAVACLLLNRHCVAMENDEFQFELMPKRLTEAITHIDANSNVETKRVSLHRVTTSAEGVEKVTEIEL